MAENKNEATEEKKNEVDIEFGLTTFSLNNRTTVYFLTFLFVILGLAAYISLPKESFPEVRQPIVYIGTVHFGNSPVDIENLITRPLEKEINTIPEAEEIKSLSVQDYSTIIVNFTQETDIENALTKVKDAVDRAKPNLPTDLKTDPNVFEINFSEFPIMNLNLSGNFSVEELKIHAEKLEDLIEKIPEISKADIRGLQKKEVKIKINPHKMEAVKVNFSDIENAIKAENLTLSGGNILDDGIRRNIRVVGEFTDPSEIENIIVKHEKGNIVYLKNLATVEFDFKETESFARMNGNPVVSIDVVKRSGQNLLITTEKILEIVQEFKKIAPKNLIVNITNDQSKDTRDMVSSLENNIISGVILVVLILLFFLGTRNSLFVGIAIPLSMFISFLVLQLLGISINMMVLFSLIMALGMLVDNGIVVVENVYRLMDAGMKPYDAVRKGVGEIAWPIISSTATTLAAFIPLAFWPGIMGQFMRYLPITLIITLSASLFVALVINPVVGFKYMKVDNRKPFAYKKIWRTATICLGVGAFCLVFKYTVLGNLIITYGLLLLLNVYILTPFSRRFQDSFLPWLENSYANLIAFALKGKNPYKFFFGSILTLIFSIALMGIFPPKVVFFPENEPTYVNIFIEKPIGTDIEEVNKFTKKIESQMITLLKPYNFIIESMMANVGEGTADPRDITAVGQSKTPNKARITINFIESKLRVDPKTGEKISTSDILNTIRETIKGNPGVLITADKDANGPPTGKPISIEVAGDDINTLITLTEDMKNYINALDIPGIERLKTDLETGKPELLVSIDREKARRFGLSTYSISNEIRTSLFGKEISKFKQGEDDYEIYIRLDDKYRYNIDALMSKNIIFRDPGTGRMVTVPISSVAKAEISSTYASIKRKNLQRIVNITSNVLAEYNPTEINNQIKSALQNFEMPEGYTYKFGGEQERQEKEMSFLSKALLIAIFMIFFIIVAQFNSISGPIIIMVSVLLSTIGVFLGLISFQMDFVIVMTMIGIISLAGVVVNNAIVLIDFIELNKKRMQQELKTDFLPLDLIDTAIIESGKTRLRPVLLTAITTVLGLIPLAIGLNLDFIKFYQNYDIDYYIGGDNAAFWGPLSWTIVFGLTFATFITLIIVPVMYWFFARVKRKFKIE